ncbi:sugar phosphate isomerase/epimerase family protein [Lederbergia wuyishanensis]|uniref:Sugar phosphate isomerase/epimerase n=1 Tax=Lederbergia wuyishanensis TaxID=1347903 RepID=A0ABU0D1Z2_9BACI|nr:sugar phosphate isomerase/epimerase family protein [Lederbergia wuyishanensis]MCJ8007037.1 sugar phosphate isomerase/epimerase [Lederbergia wuyishanensis]MDQ0342422.1 sugar phosphate isomerase/epimerase [Lederbergia wuyishanensis]
MFKYSLTQWIFGNENLEESLKRLQKYEYQGVELAGEPEFIDIQKTKELLEKYQMECSSICGIYYEDRDLSSENIQTRKNAIDYAKQCIDMAKALGARIVIVVPTYVGKVKAESEEEWNHAIASVREVGKYAKQHNIILAIEAINRYETYLVTNLHTAKRFVEEVDLENVKIMADFFHMNIEEQDMLKSLTNISEYLVHVHIADNTREAAGLGQTDFSPIMSFLSNNNYSGYISMEFLPSVSNPYLVSEHSSKSNKYDDYAKQSINHIKDIVKNLYTFGGI